MDDVVKIITIIGIALSSMYFIYPSINTSTTAFPSSNSETQQNASASGFFNQTPETGKIGGKSKRRKNKKQMTKRRKH